MLARGLSDGVLVVYNSVGNKVEKHVALFVAATFFTQQLERWARNAMHIQILHFYQTPYHQRPLLCVDRTLHAAK